MKRLVKKSSGEFTYKFKSPIFVNFSDEWSFKGIVENLNDVDSEIARTVKDAISDSMRDLGNKGLAEYLDDRKSYSNDIESIIVTVEGGNAITVVKANKELSENELDDLAQYITGQFSDGWGEGFEQQTLDSWTETSEDEVWDEEAQEIYMEESEYQVDITASLWSTNDWSITLI